MARPLFNAKCTLTSCTPNIDPSIFDIIASIVDAEGNFSGLDVSLGDYIVIDTSGAEAGSISKYKITNITSQTFTTLTCRVQYDDIDAPIDAAGGIGVAGFICRSSSVNNLLWVAPNDTQGFAQKVSTYANNIMSFQKHESGLMKSNIESYVVGLGGVLQGRLVYYSSGTVMLADNSSQASSSILGVALSTVTQGNNCSVYKYGIVPSGIITVNCFVGNVFPSDSSWVFLAGNGQYTTQAPLPTSNSYETLVGVWVNGSLNLQVNQWGIA